MTFALDLFAGPGGWDVAARGLGIATLGIETDADACATARLAGFRRIQADVSVLDPRDLADGNPPLDGLIASPPCQPFSFSGLGAGRAGKAALLAGAARIAEGEEPRTVIKAVDDELADPRAALVLEPLRWALDLRPEWVALEQVPPVLPLWEATADVLRANGYAAVTGLLEAERYGLPQTRCRAILLARRSGPVALPVPTHRGYRKGVGQHEGDPELAPWVSMADALGWLGPGAVGFPRRDDGRPSGAVLIAGTAYRARDLRRSDEPAFVLTEKARSWRRFADGEPVRVSVREASVLQGFPADYPWQGSNSSQFHQIGDAIPPTLAHHVLAQAIGEPLGDLAGVAGAGGGTHTPARPAGSERRARLHGGHE